MPKCRNRCAPRLLELEARLLLAGQSPTATWLGQDGVDLVGGSSAASPGDGLQDIDILLSNLPTGRSVSSIDIVGDGGDEWVYNYPFWNPWTAALVRSGTSSTAHLYIDPTRNETGRNFFLTITYSDGSTASVVCAGGTASTSLRMPSQSLQATWKGQDGHDLTGPGPSVGPNGIHDVHLALKRLSANLPIDSVTVSSSGGATWVTGLNPNLKNNAELVPNPSDPTQADLYFEPIGNMSGQTLTVSIIYNNGKIDPDSTTVAAQTTNPALAMPAPASVPLSWNGVTANWLGQDGQNLHGAGDVHVALSGIPAGTSIVSAMLSDESRVSWYYNQNGGGNPLDPNSLPMVVRAVAGQNKADVDFSPARDETGRTMTLSLVLSNGSIVATQFPGGAADPGLCAPLPASSSVVAQPGDNLNTLANKYGTVRLSAGVYSLSQPLVLTKPVTITGDPGAIIQFTQPSNAASWSEAITIQAGHTTLTGFGVQFSGPVQWNWNTFFGPSVIGAGLTSTGQPATPLDAISITKLNLQSSPAATSWEPSANLIRLTYAQNGIVSNNTLKGGSTVLFNGPWQVTNNAYQGPMPNTYAYSVFSVENTHDFQITNNTISPTAGSGKAWRFLVMVQSGIDDIVQNNSVVGVGPMDNDTVANPNAPETLLTESYRLHFEGTPSAISPDGRLLQIPTPQGGQANTGDVVAILTGPNAGQWFMIAQALSPTSYLLDKPLPAGNYTISISDGGFVNELYKGNTIDTTGSSVAQNMVLAGNHFGTDVVGNTFIGGAQSFRITAYPTGSPGIWGWSHDPMFGVTVEDNTFENAATASILEVPHTVYTKSNQGRLYMSVSLSDNTLVWTDGFIAQNGGKTPPTALMVGDSLSGDPGELVVTMQGNQIAVAPNVQPGSFILIAAGRVNGQSIVNQSTAWPTIPPPPSANLRLVNDNGVSSSDGITSDPRLAFDAVSAMAGYEYSLTGQPGSYQPVSSPSAFVPAGLAQGFNTVFVRAFDATGNRSSVVAIAFVNDTTSQPSASDSNPAPGIIVYRYRLGTTGSFIPLGQSTSVDSSLLLSGAPALQITTAAATGSSGAHTPHHPTPQTPGAGARGSQESSTAYGPQPISGPGAFPAQSSVHSIFDPFLLRAKRHARVHRGGELIRVIGLAWKRAHLSSTSSAAQGHRDSSHPNARKLRVRPGK